MEEGLASGKDIPKGGVARYRVRVLLKFITQVSRGILSDLVLRRKTLFGLVVLDLLLLALGALALDGFLYAHPGLFVVYWLFCAWLTLGMGLLAVFDLLKMLAAARTEREYLKTEL